MTGAAGLGGQQKVLVELKRKVQVLCGMSICSSSQKGYPRPKECDHDRKSVHQPWPFVSSVKWPFDTSNTRLVLHVAVTKHRLDFIRLRAGFLLCICWTCTSAILGRRDGDPRARCMDGSGRNKIFQYTPQNWDRICQHLKIKDCNGQPKPHVIIDRGSDSSWMKGPREIHGCQDLNWQWRFNNKHIYYTDLRNREYISNLRIFIYNWRIIYNIIEYYYYTISLYLEKLN